MPLDIRYATIIPLIGGMNIGNTFATGRKPEYILSYPPFKKNDSHILNYWTDIQYHVIESEPISGLGSVDFVSAMPPCAGLSSLTSNSTSKEIKDSKNEWLMKSSEYVLEHIRPTVLFGENAPNLYTKKGEPIVEKLVKIGERYGYGFSLYLTDTIKHGIPQKRKRTFYFFWKNGVPLMPSISRPRKTLLDYLDEIPEWASYQDVFNKKEAFTDTIAYKYLIKTFGKNWRQEFHGDTIMSNFAGNPDSLNTLITFSKDVGDMKFARFVEHAQQKLMAHKNYWNNSPHFCGAGGRDFIHAIQGRISEWSVHPAEDRWINRREYMHLMGLPHDFQLADEKSGGHIVQNVPVNTARDMTECVIQYIHGMYQDSGTTFHKHDNFKEVSLEKPLF